MLQSRFFSSKLTDPLFLKLVLCLFSENTNQEIYRMETLDLIHNVQPRVSLHNPKLDRYLLRTLLRSRVFRQFRRNLHIFSCRQHNICSRHRKEEISLHSTVNVCFPSNVYSQVGCYRDLCILLTFDGCHHLPIYLGGKKELA